MEEIKFINPKKGKTREYIHESMILQDSKMKKCVIRCSFDEHIFFLRSAHIVKEDAGISGMVEVVRPIKDIRISNVGTEDKESMPGDPSSEVNPYFPSLEKIIDGVFLHGRETPNIIGRSELPSGQYTVQEAIGLIEQHIKKGQSNV